MLGIFSLNGNEAAGTEFLQPFFVFNVGWGRCGGNSECNFAPAEGVADKTTKRKELPMKKSTFAQRLFLELKSIK